MTAAKNASIDFTNVKAEDFTLKSVKHNERLSEDSHCFSARLYFKGKQFCEVSDNGMGGCVDYRPIANGKMTGGEVWAAVRKINETLQQTKVPVGAGTDHEINLDLEIVVGDLVNDWLLTKDCKKSLKKVCYLEQQEDGTQNLWTYKGLPLNQASYDRVKMSEEWKDGNILLNELPVEEAMEKLKKHFRSQQPQHG